MCLIVTVADSLSISTRCQSDYFRIWHDWHTGLHVHYTSRQHRHQGNILFWGDGWPQRGFRNVGSDIELEPMLVFSTTFTEPAPTSSTLHVDQEWQDTHACTGPGMASPTTQTSSTTTFTESAPTSSNLHVGQEWQDTHACTGPGMASPTTQTSSTSLAADICNCWSYNLVKPFLLYLVLSVITYTRIIYSHV